MKKHLLTLLCLVALAPMIVSYYAEFLGSGYDAPDSRYNTARYEYRAIPFAHGGTGNLSSPSQGSVIRSSHITQLTGALQEDLVPRNSSGVPTDEAGSLGSTTYKWLKAHVESGGLFAGLLMPAFPYDGAVTCAQGWMLADGDIINETNYDAEHSAGDWDKYVGSSPLDGKYLPNMPGKYPVGAAAVAQDGTSAITSVGNSSHQVDLQHSHTVNSHTHTESGVHLQWYNDGSGNHQGWDGNGIFNNIQTGAHTSGAEVGICIGDPAGSSGYGTCSTLGGDWRTNNANAEGGVTGSSSPGTDNQLSATQSIQPESIETIWCMRIIE